MGFKSGLVIGFGIGYVLGSQAGRQRYEEIKRTWGAVVDSPVVKKAAGMTKEAAEEGARKGLGAVQQGVEKAGSAVRERLHRSEDDQTERIVDLAEDQDGQSRKVIEGTYREELTKQKE
jgi:hypothetical protein